MKAKHVLLATALCLAPALASADELSIAPTVTGETGLFTLFSGDTLPQGGWAFGLSLSNVDRVLESSILSEDDKGLDWTTFRASLGYGITDSWEMSVMVPYEDFNFDSGSGLDDQSGLGNVRLATKFRVMGERDSPSTFAINLFVEPETGDEDVVGDDMGFGGGLNWRANKWVFDIGYHDPGNDDERILGGIGYVGSVSDRLDWITEVTGTTYDNLEDAYDLTTGGRAWLGENQNVALNFALRLDLNQISDIDEHCPIGGLLGLAFVPGRAPAVMPEPPPPPPAPEPPPPPPPVVTPPPPPPPAPAPRPEQRETIQFGPGSARLDNIAKAKLDEVALQMKQDPALSAEVLGYSDSQGPESANLRISQQRADAVKNYLVTRHGIDPARISTDARGEADPVGDNATAEGRAANRRAVIILKVM
jgi:outer membrane protein OmpA-like peptidoglycan-associated protein